MNVGFYQNASALSALERWQDAVAQNITSSQTSGYRKRTANVLATPGGEVRTGARPGGSNASTAVPMQFPQLIAGINFKHGEVQPTRREFDLALQGDGFFEVRRPDGNLLYTRSGEFRMRLDRTLTTSSGEEVLNSEGEPIVLQPDNGKLSVNLDGTLMQGTTQLGRLAVKSFDDPSKLEALAGDFFRAPAGLPPPTLAEKPEVLQGFLESSNVSPLREMVDIIVITRAYEANQKMISTVDQQMQKALDALG
jgi:flagellar basal-body rod protein FlgF